LLAARGLTELEEITPDHRAAFTALVVRALPAMPTAAVREALHTSWLSAHERTQDALRSAGLVEAPTATSRAPSRQCPAMQIAALATAPVERDTASDASGATGERDHGIKKSFSWMPATATAAAGLPDATARAAAALDAVDVKRGVLHGVIPDDQIPGIHDPNVLRFSLPAKAAGVVATQMRDATAALLNPMAFDVADRLHALCKKPMSELFADAPGVNARVKALPHASHAADPSMPLADVPEDFATGLEELFGIHERAFERAALIADSGSSDTDSAFPGPTFLRAPVGEYGADLALALVDAGRILMRESAVVAAQTAGSSAYAEMNPKLIIGDDVAMSWRQGIEGLVSSVALLVGKRVVGKTADEVLASLEEGSVLLQLASRAPFYSAEPLAGSGHVSKEPLVFDAHGKARLPVSVIGFARDAAQVREEFSADAKSDYALAQMQAGAENSTETRRGCPLAAKVPMYDAEGLLRMSEHSGIEKIGSAYLELVRHLLRERSALPAGPTGA
jgi:hypothetical protein